MDEPAPASPRGPVALAAEGLTKRFGAATVLRGVSVELLGGEVHSLVGENGAGKSTLLKILSGEYVADEGVVRLDGADVTPRTPRAALAHGIYRVPQEPSLIPDLSVGENVFLGVLPLRGRAAGIVDWGSLNARTREVLQRLDLRVDPRQPAGRLTIAQQQLVECARAMVHACRVILFDEPTSPLTVHEVEVLFRTVEALRASGCAIGFISHRLDEVLELSDRVTVLRDGEVVASTGRAETTREGLLRAMVGRELAAHRRRSRRDRRAAVLEVEGLTGEPDFRDVSFSVEEGEILGVAGLVGSGRTQIAETIMGLRRRDSGTVRVGGEEVRGRRRTAAAAGVVYVPEDRARHSLFLQLSVAKNVSAGDLGLIARRPLPLLSRRRERRNAEEVFARMQVRGPGTEAPIRALSGGNQQKTILGRWLLTRPRVAILDEPTRGVDVGTKQEIYELLEELAAEGLAIVVISSELEELVQVCDRVVAIYEGEVVAERVGDEIDLEGLGRAIVDPPAGSRPAARRDVAEPGSPARRLDPMALLARARGWALLLAMLLLALAVGAGRHSFLSGGNIDFMLLDSVVLGLVALGETFVLLGRGIDLSVAPIVGLAAVGVGMHANNDHLPLGVAIVLAPLIGAAFGAVNAVLVALLEVPAIIATLGTLFVYTGVAYVYLNGNEVDQMPSSYTRFGNEHVLPYLPLPVVIMAGLALVSWLAIRYTAFGRAVLAVGGGAAAARTAGLRVRALTASTYVLSGLFAGFAGLIEVCYTGYASAQTGTGTSIELTAIAAALIGGTAISGGRGNPIGSVLGAILLSVALTSVVFLHVPAVWEPAGQGVLIVAAAAFDVAVRRRLTVGAAG